MSQLDRIRALYSRIHELSQLYQWDAAQATCEELVQLAPNDGLA